MPRQFGCSCKSELCWWTASPDSALTRHRCLCSYKTAQQSAQASIEAGGRFTNDRPTYASKHGAVISSLLKGLTYETPPALRRRVTAAQKAANNTLAFKAMIRLSRAHAGMCRNLFKVAPAAFDDKARAAAQRHLNEANEGERLRHDVSGVSSLIDTFFFFSQDTGKPTV